MTTHPKNLCNKAKIAVKEDKKDLNTTTKNLNKNIGLKSDLNDVIIHDKRDIRLIKANLKKNNKILKNCK